MSGEYVIPAGPEYRYLAFLSYSHADEKPCAWLHRALERYRIPRHLVARITPRGQVPPRLFPVFRDREELSGSADLPRSIEQALESSRFLVVLCSPKAAVSRWVNEEVRRFKARGGADRVFCVILDGEPFASDKPESGLLECLPEAVRHTVSSDGRILAERAEPLACDLRPGKGGRVNAKLKLVAGILGIDFDELRQRDRRRARQQRLALAALGTVAAAVVLTLFVYGYQERRIADARALSTRALDSVERDPIAALALAADAVREAETPESQEALTLTLPAMRLRSVLHHKGPVRDVAVSPDGRYVATASDDRTARLWELATGREARLLAGHSGALTRVLFSPDGSRVLTASRDHTARLWESSSGACLHVLASHQDEIVDAVFSPNGDRVATASRDTTAWIWDAASGTPQVQLRGHTGALSSIAFSKDGAQVLTSSQDRTARLWNSVSGASERTLKDSDEPLISASFSPKSGHIAITGAENTTRVFDADHQVYMLHGFEGTAFPAAFSPDGEEIVAMQNGSAPEVRDGETGGQFDSPESGREVRYLRGHEGPVGYVSFSPDSSTILTASEDKTARVWDADFGHVLYAMRAHTGKVTKAIFSPDGLHIVTAGEDNRAFIWNAGSEDENFLVPDGPAVAQSPFALSPDGLRIAISMEDFSVAVRSLRDGKRLLTLRGHQRRITSLRYSADGSRLLTTSDDDTARLWNTLDGSAVVVLSAPKVRYADLSPDGRQAVTFGIEKIVHIWDLVTAQQAGVLAGHTGYLKSVAFAHDGSKVVTTAYDRTARVWDLHGTELLRLEDPFGFDFAVISPRGDLILTVSSDGVVRLWDTASGHQIRTLARVPGADVVNPPTPARPWTSDSAPALRILRGQCLGLPAVFSEDGSQLLTRVQYNPMRLWDVHTGREFYRLPGMSSLVDSCFSADGSRVVSLSGSGMLHFYPTRFRDLMALADLRLRAARAALR